MPQTQSKRARLALPSTATTIAAGTAIAINQATLALTFEGDSSLSLGASAAEFSQRYPQNVKITIAGQLADEDDLTWVSPTSFSWSRAIWPGSDIVIEEIL